MEQYLKPLLILLITALVSGCASPSTKFYTLSSVPIVKLLPKIDPYAIAIAIDSVKVPDLVDRAQIVSRQGTTEVAIDEFARWADPLKNQIARVVAADLGHFIPEAMVTTYPQQVDDNAYHISINVEAFDSSMGDSVTISALWSVNPPKPAKRVSGRTVVREFVSGPGYEALVKAHSRALSSVASAIATAIRSVEIQ